MATSAQQAKFQSYLERNLRYLSDLVATEIPLPNAETRIQAMHTLSYAFVAPTQWELTKALVLALTPTMEQVDHRDHWLVYLKQAALLSEQYQDWVTAAEFYLDCGRFYFQQDQNEQATLAYEHALGLFRQGDDPRGEAWALVNLGNIFVRYKEWSKAEQLFQAARRLYQTIEDTDSEWAILSNLGLLYHEQGQSAEGIAILEACRQRARQHKFLQPELWVTNNLGDLYRQQERWEEALTTLEIALHLARQANEPLEEAKALERLARV